MIALITGGVRSGKSRFATRYAAHLGQQGIFVATAVPFDDEMTERVRCHQREREQSAFYWKNVEKPYDLSEFFHVWRRDSEHNAKQTVVLVDCLTVWLSNWLLRYENDQPSQNVTKKIDELVGAIQDFPGTLLLVTNEVGYGLVPEYALGRYFRDLAGILNQRMATISDQVFLVTAGIPLEVKSKAYQIGE
ncbi:bifunctional adenosylcobinamide kinase/adenosylcobinamide-phosphate guanylyltransferase [Brevibacillus ruminantium]|uniref:Adenosylcobinamide kinase n=1 Tax=Brevibacillus ruminantium TaxID=2950604 RepID=A0ABY4W847_9BACL|nr:bifunctional adenosylcobinamide kinase/adenosylcobinamide-phosphate guanylyltransferase [Brevibacillus ruminantium]USG63350.1 bifunctional adenosylcobinamide kinase/adenosylcobinamide-phosphate guanylyltransferase [Brevibacillus ruminantium]